MQHRKSQFPILNSQFSNLNSQFTILPLSAADREAIKGEKRLGNTFLYFFTGLALILLLFISYYRPIVYISATLLLAVVVVSRLINRKYNRDLARGKKHVYHKDIKELLVNPSLSDTQPYATPYFRRLSNYHAGYGVRAGSQLFLIDKATYDRLQGQHQCAVHYAPESATFLGVYPIE